MTISDRYGEFSTNGNNRVQYLRAREEKRGTVGITLRSD